MGRLHRQFRDLRRKAKNNPYARSNVDYFFDHCVPASSTSNQKLADHIDACIKHDQIRASCRPIDQAMSHWPL